VERTYRKEIRNTKGRYTEKAKSIQLKVEKSKRLLAAALTVCESNFLFRTLCSQELL
jgi:hypothetical protein